MHYIKLNSGNSETDSGVIVETSDTDDARIFYNVTTNNWEAGENRFILSSYYISRCSCRW